jgi:hypothetical protein
MLLPPCTRPSCHADSAPSFFDEVERISDPNYIPIESDVLRARTKTTGIYETRFTMGQLSIQYVPMFKRTSGASANMKQHV